MCFHIVGDISLVILSVMVNGLIAIIPASCEAEVGGLQIQDLSGQLSEILSQNKQKGMRVVLSSVPSTITTVQDNVLLVLLHFFLLLGSA